MDRLTCTVCGRAGTATDGFLRPEGFLCHACYAKRMKDPAYVAQLEGELLGLVAAVNRGAESAAEASPAVTAPRSPARLSFDSLVGLSVGDAVGATREGRPFDPGGRALRLPPPGSRLRWTDDTQMAVSVVEVLQETGAIDQDRLADAFSRRYEPWRGYGAGMHALLSCLRGGEDWRQARFAVFREGSFGNGSAMRVAPLGAFLADRSADDVVAQATRSAEVTHAHPEGVNGAVAVALAAWHFARSRGGPALSPTPLLGAVGAVLPAGSEVALGLHSARALPPGAPLEKAVRLLGNGSRVSCADTVPLALWLAASHADDYRAAIETAVAAGGDTDTLAAIVGGIVAARLSPSAIPVEWRQAVEPLPLRDPDDVERSRG